MYISALSKIHVAILHRDEKMESMKGDEATIRKYITYPVYIESFFVDYQSTKPLHTNLKKELTQNRAYKISEEAFESALASIKELMQTSKWREEEVQWRASVTSTKYGVVLGDSLGIENLLVLHLYCGNTALCSSFRGSYRKENHFSSNRHEIAMKYHQENYYWFGRFIYASIHFFGRQPECDSKFYRGLQGQFLFGGFSAIFEYVPLSLCCASVHIDCHLEHLRRPQWTSMSLRTSLAPKALC